MKRAELRVGLVLVVGLVGMALLSFVWTPFGPTAVGSAPRLLPPGWPHLLGTDHMGIDTFSRLLGGARSVASLLRSVPRLGAGPDRGAAGSRVMIEGPRKGAGAPTASSRSRSARNRARPLPTEYRRVMASANSDSSWRTAVLEVIPPSIATRPRPAPEHVGSTLAAATAPGRPRGGAGSCPMDTPPGVE